MSDLATALRNALAAQTLNKDINNWHAEEEKRLHSPQQSMDRKKVVIVSLTEMVFNYMRDNPNKTNQEITSHFEANGYKYSSVSSLVTQFVNAGMATRNAEGRITMQAKTYASPSVPSKLATKANKRKDDYKQRSIKRLATLAAKKQAMAQATVAKREEIKAQTSTSPGIAALRPQTAPVQLQPALISMAPEQIIDALSVRQARELYAALKEFFG